VEDRRAVISKTPQFLDLAGSIHVPTDRRSATWDDVLRVSRSRRSPSN
jgi:hypothetical protein